MSTTTTPSKHKVPETHTEWSTRAGELGLSDTALHQLPYLRSASQLEEEEFICMRVYWPKTKGKKSFPFPREFDHHAAETAVTIAGDFPDLRTYLNHLRRGTRSPVDRNMGAFSLVMQSQLQIPLERLPGSEGDESVAVIRRSPRNHQSNAPPISSTVADSDVSMTDASTTDSGSTHRTAAADSNLQFGPTKDEQLVNDALLLFLRAVTIFPYKLRCEWYSARSPFDTASFGINSMTARTDGYLEANGEVFSIVEVKPQIRDRVKRPEVLWQETSEMVAWIMHDEKNGRQCPLRRRLLVSQDNHEIFLTIAEYDPEYVRYLKGEFFEASNFGGRSTKPFLKMQEYGPWDITVPNDMEYLAEIVLGVALEVEHDLTA
ncbi:hypothetical protein N7465_002153 [Penicillium sp. CMV-2018d]|nr:hypothetical protein N7465_002153 [Penicillium sp. CMV-2018d]